MFTGREVVFDLAEDPGAALGGAADHDGIGAGSFQHELGFLRRRDVAVGDQGDTDSLAHGGDGVVFGIAGVAAGACTAVHG